jgi:hypothetical protein
VTFAIGVALCSLIWAMYLMRAPAPTDIRSRVGQVVICLALGWASMLILEGFGLIGEYAGPEPHM